MLESPFLLRALAACLVLALGASGGRADEPLPPEVRFLEGDAAKAAITDESLEPYFSVLQPLELIAKAGPLSGATLAAQRESAAARYRAACRDFTAEEKAAIGDAARALDLALGATYPLFARTPWQFLKLDDSVEGGLPHTRARCVVLPASLATAFVEMQRRGQAPAKSVLGEILVHEKCHVMQRLWPAMFETLYVQTWGFVRAKGLASCPWLLEHQVVNPDGADVGWVYPVKNGAATEYWQPLVILREGVPAPRMPGDFEIVAIALDRRGDTFAPRVGAEGKPVMRPLTEVEAYRRAFGAVFENFHPHETFAVLFSWIAMRHTGADGPGISKHPDADLAPLTAWCKTHFAAQPGPPR